jgi:hypothetical protein
VIWTPTVHTTIRTAAFRAAKRSFIAGQTIEPTQVAGFNQFFDDPDGATSWRYGAGLDQALPFGIRVGVEHTERTIETPALLIYRTWHERQERLYFYWPITRLRGSPALASSPAALSAEYQEEQLKRPEEDTGFEGIVSLRTRYLPLGIVLFPGRGTSLQVRMTYVTQQGRLQQDVGTTSFPVESNFWVTDIAMGHRIPGMRGNFSVGVSNLFDRRFAYVDPDAASPRFARERMAFARLTVQF